MLWVKENKRHSGIATGKRLVKMSGCTCLWASLSLCFFRYIFACIDDSKVLGISVEWCPEFDRQQNTAYCAHRPKRRYFSVMFSISIFHCIDLKLHLVNLTYSTCIADAQSDSPSCTDLICITRPWQEIKTRLLLAACNINVKAGQIRKCFIVFIALEETFSRGKYITKPLFLMIQFQ